MLSLDITGTFAKSITPNFGIPDQEFIGMRTLMKKNIEDWLKEREQGEHGWSMYPYDRQMDQKLKDVAMQRMQYSGFLRNLAVAISNSGLENKEELLQKIEKSAGQITNDIKKDVVLKTVQSLK
jgi:hypothetical protein